MMRAANEASLNGFNGLAGAIAELLRAEVGGRGNYGRTVVQAAPDFAAVE
jgi:hypothetical protein